MSSTAYVTAACDEMLLREHVESSQQTAFLINFM